MKLFCRYILEFDYADFWKERNSVVLSSNYYPKGSLRGKKQKKLNSNFNKIFFSLSDQILGTKAETTFDKKGGNLGLGKAGDPLPDKKARQYAKMVHKNFIF
jgi:hypothetical protein